MFVKNVANHALIPPHRALVPPLKSPPYGGGPIPPHVKICMDNPGDIFQCHVNMGKLAFTAFLRHHQDYYEKLNYISKVR